MFADTVNDIFSHINKTKVIDFELIESLHDMLSTYSTNQTSKFVEFKEDFLGTISENLKDYLKANPCVNKVDLTSDELDRIENVTKKYADSIKIELDKVSGKDRNTSLRHLLPIKIFSKIENEKANRIVQS